MHDADGVAMALPSGKSQHVYISHVGGEEEQAALLEEWLWRQGLVTCRGAPDRVVGSMSMVVLLSHAFVEEVNTNASGPSRHELTEAGDAGLVCGDDSDAVIVVALAPEWADPAKWRGAAGLLLGNASVVDARKQTWREAVLERVLSLAL